MLVHSALHVFYNSEIVYSWNKMQIPISNNKTKQY